MCLDLFLQVGAATPAIKMCGIDNLPMDEGTGKTWVLDDERFANLFMGSDDHLGLVVMATCESAKTDDRRASWASRRNWCNVARLPSWRCSTLFMSKPLGSVDIL